jgi:hypothetical protein
MAASDIANVPTITIEGRGKTLVFAYSMKEFTDTYEGTYAPNIKGPATPHPSSYMFEGGEFRPMTLEMSMAVGVGLINSVDDLKNTVRDVVSLAIPAKPGDIPKVLVTIAKFYRRYFHPTNVTITWGEPWTSDGYPTVCDVSMSLVSDFTSPPWADSFDFNTL